jgi:hypothetical protein
LPITDQNEKIIRRVNPRLGVYEFLDKLRGTGSLLLMGLAPAVGRPQAPGVARSEEATMAGLVRNTFDAPEEVRPFEDNMGILELVNLDSGPVGRATFQPGWQWSKHVKPIAGTDSCQASHMGYVISGRMVIRMNDGQEVEFGPHDFMIAPPGHDAWIVGDEPCVVIDWQGVADYAKAVATSQSK